MIARKKEEAIQKKKDRGEGEQVEHETHKRENLKKRNIGSLEEEEGLSPSIKKEKIKWKEKIYHGSRGRGTREL